MRPRQNGCHFPDDISKCIFLNEIVLIVIKNVTEVYPKGPINNIRALVKGNNLALKWRKAIIWTYAD